MRIKGKFNSSAAILGLLALPVVSLFGGSLNVNAVNIDKDNNVTVKKGEIFDGEGKTYNSITVVGSDTTIENAVLSSDSSLYLIRLTGDVSHTTIDNIKLEKGAGYGIKLDKESNLSDSQINNISFGDLQVDMSLNGAAKTSNVWITNNTFNNPSQVYGKADDPITGLNIEGNTFNFAKGSGPMLTVWNANNTKIKRNHFVGPKEGNVANAISIVGATDPLWISGNDFSSNIDTGIRFVARNSTKFEEPTVPSSNVTITGNTSGSDKDFVQIMSGSVKAGETSNIVSSGNNTKGSQAVDGTNSVVKLSTKEADIAPEPADTGKPIITSETPNTNPGKPVEPVAPTAPEENPVTKPKDESKTAEVAVPNTGAQNILNAVGISTAVAAIALAGSVIARRIANDNR